MKTENYLKIQEKIDEAADRFDHYGFSYEVKNYDIGHIHVWDLDGNRFQFWAGTGKILGHNAVGIEALIELLINGKRFDDSGKD